MAAMATSVHSKIGSMFELTPVSRADWWERTAPDMDWLGHANSSPSLCAAAVLPPCSSCTSSNPDDMGPPIFQWHLLQLHQRTAPLTGSALKQPPAVPCCPSWNQWSHLLQQATAVWHPHGQHSHHWNIRVLGHLHRINPRPRKWISISRFLYCLYFCTWCETWTH